MTRIWTDTLLVTAGTPPAGATPGSRSDPGVGDPGREIGKPSFRKPAGFAVGVVSVGVPVVVRAAAFWVPADPTPFCLGSVDSRADAGAADAVLVAAAGCGTALAAAVIADVGLRSTPLGGPDRRGVTALFSAACWLALLQNPVSRNTRSTSASARRAAIGRSSVLPQPRAC
ncbi:hypothetical protein GCM10010464_82580 [Pseudonocardia yunnanensis]|uniref:Uncharacterized protein n=1 Tax=Pseudonocardia yunnanensis TaxID=58107 RepID=A0ABW4EUF4_9PSEU